MKQYCSICNWAKYQVVFLRSMLLYVLFAHGWTKLTGGIERRTALGEAMSVYGINFLPEMWGFFAAYAESIGVIFIFIGLFTRFHAFFLAFTMLTAILTKIIGDPGIEKLSEISSAVFIFTSAFAVLLSGAGPILNLDKKIFQSTTKNTTDQGEQ